MAFLVNLLAFPFFLGLLPYVAKDVYGIGQSGLGYLAAAFASGALAGSLVVGASRLPLRAGRVMLWSGAAWFVAILLFGQTRSLGTGSCCCWQRDSSRVSASRLWPRSCCAHRAKRCAAA